MNSGGLDKRGRALEDEFFHRVDQKLMDDMKARMEAQAERDALKAICNWADEALLDSLVANGVTAESLLAISLVPLVRVAWADRVMETKEREAILKAADENQCETGSVAHNLLESWLEVPPSEEMFQMWKDYIAGLCGALSSDDRSKLQDQLMSHAKNVAHAAGGFLGLASISAQEQAVLDEIQSAFAD